jgi:hypothetical protein
VSSRLREFLAGLLAQIVLGGQSPGGTRAQGLLGESAALAALATAEAFGLDPGLTQLSLSQRTEPVVVSQTTE